MAKNICVACGTQFPEGEKPKICPICAEERQYIPLTGQKWTTHPELSARHKTKIEQVRDNLYQFYIDPQFGIGQRAFLVISEHGNVLWDCIPLLDNEIINFIKSKGGLKAIAISHPHYYSNMNEWAVEFNCPIYIHQNDEEYIVDKGSPLKLWTDDALNLWDNLTIVNLGGHFEGGCVLLIQQMTEKGVMLCSDILQISLSREFIAMMYSYPNNIPLPLSEIERMRNRLKELDFDTLYGSFYHQDLTENVRTILDDSIARYFA